MRSRSVNLINLIKNQCDFVMQDKKDLPKSLSNLALTYYLFHSKRLKSQLGFQSPTYLTEGRSGKAQTIEDRSKLQSYIALLSFLRSSIRFCLIRGGVQLSLAHPFYALHRSNKSSIYNHCVGKSFARHLVLCSKECDTKLHFVLYVIPSKELPSVAASKGSKGSKGSFGSKGSKGTNNIEGRTLRTGRFLRKHTKLPPLVVLIRGNSQPKTSYLVLLLVKIVAFTKRHKLRTNKKISKIFLQSIEYKYALPLRQFLALEGALKQTTNGLMNFCSNSKNNQKNDKSLLITFSGGQDSVTLLVLLFGIQSQNLLKLNILWNHHLWHKDSFFITRHVLKLSFLFKISTHNAIAITPVKTELQARQWRLRVSRRLNSFYKYQSVMQAHSGTDKIETLLLNLFRGTGNTSPFHSTDFSLNFSQAQKRKLFFK